LGENLPPGDSDWGNLTIASQLRTLTAYIVYLCEPSKRAIYGIITEELHERDKDV
jgi:hypothetical protein